MKNVAYKDGENKQIKKNVRKTKVLHAVPDASLAAVVVLAVTAALKGG